MPIHTGTDHHEGCCVVSVRFIIAYILNNYYTAALLYILYFACIVTTILCWFKLCTINKHCYLCLLISSVFYIIFMFRLTKVIENHKGADYFIIIVGNFMAIDIPIILLQQ